MERRKIPYYVYLLACVLVLTCTPAVKLLTNQTAATVILFLETGHILRPYDPPAGISPQQTQPAEQTPPPTQTTAPPEVTVPPTEPVLLHTPAFSPADASLVQVNSYCGYTPDVPAWLATPLSWDLQQAEPTVLILHSHATEGYENATGTNHRTQDTGENMVSIGAAVAQRLEQAGIRVIRDTSLHDYPSYSDAYANSRAAAQKYLAQYPSIALILDLHRDSVTDSQGRELKYTLQTPEGTAAKMMFVVGTDAGGLSHSKWSENMSLAVKLHALLEKQNPGICRPISFRTQRFNQDLSTGALLVEMGAAGNTRQEALLAAEYLAQAIIELAKGTAQ